MMIIIIIIIIIIIAESNEWSFLRRKVGLEWDRIFSFA